MNAVLVHHKRFVSKEFDEQRLVMWARYMKRWFKAMLGIEVFVQSEAYIRRTRIYTFKPNTEMIRKVVAVCDRLRLLSRAGATRNHHGADT